MRPSPTPGPPAARSADRAQSRAAACRSSFQRDEIRRQVMDVRVAPLREPVDVPLQRIGHDDFGDRIVSGEAAIRPVGLSQRNDEGGEMVELSLYALSRG